jgi:hypothetical protein
MKENKTSLRTMPATREISSMIYRTFFALFCLLVITATMRAGDVVETAVIIPKVPYIITKPGLYELRADVVLDGTTGTAITIKASSVVLDLGGHTITNVVPLTTSTTSATGVSSNDQNDLTVRNGAVVNFENGILLSSGTAPGHIFVQSVVADNSVATGISVGGDVVEVTDCHIETAGDNGISASGNFVTVADNEVLNIGGSSGNGNGIQVAPFFESTVSRNRVANSSMGGKGILFVTFNNSNQLLAPASFAVDNVIFGYGIGLSFGPSQGKYLNNLTEDCTTPFAGTATAATGNN